MAERVQSGNAWTCSACGGFVRSDSPHCKHCKVVFDGTPAPVVASPPSADDKAMLQWIIATRTTQGWQVVSQSETGVQFKKPKQWSVAGLLLFVAAPAALGCLWYPAFGIALIGLLIVLADYLMRKEELAFVTADQARSEAREWRAKQA